MNRTIRRGGTAIVVLVLALLVNITYIQVIKANEYRSSPYNPRVLYEEVSRQRGQITAAGGVVLAKSDRTDDAYRYQRLYPSGPAYANLTGYYALAYPPSALEAAQDQLLSGESADLLVDRVGDFLTGRDPRGGNVELTILPQVQQAAYDQLVSQNLVGTVVAIRPSTGEILAMVSTPSFDPNGLASHNTTDQTNAYQLLTQRIEGTASANTNRSIDNVYPPGSTFKMLVAAAALEQGYTSQSPLTGAAEITLPGTNGQTLENYGGTTCASGNGRDDVTLTTALAHSCNPAFAQLGQQIGADAIRREAVALGIDGTVGDLGLIGIGDDPSVGTGGLRVEPSRLGDLADEPAVMQSSIGQRDIALTPLQTAIITATIANNGVRMAPYLISRTTAPDLKQLAVSVPTPANATAMSASTAEQLTAMMTESEQVTGGSGTIEGVTIASKTGTAEHGEDPKNTPPYVSYAAFAPAQDPQVAVIVFVESGPNVDLSATGRSVAAPIGRAVIAAALTAA